MKITSKYQISAQKTLNRTRNLWIQKNKQFLTKTLQGNSHPCMTFHQIHLHNRGRHHKPIPSECIVYWRTWTGRWSYTCADTSLGLHRCCRHNHLPRHTWNDRVYTWKRQDDDWDTYETNARDLRFSWDLLLNFYFYFNSWILKEFPRKAYVTFETTLKNEISENI